ncbi:hypothetical protein SEA_GODPHATHER_14 [Mycobacterium phage GodPhather]|nr:hypothetical protein SEA_GODPHATHER_14 [Mycobacterium phage GodPhather]
MEVTKAARVNPKHSKWRIWMRHTRVVKSGSPPLYRMLTFGMLCSGIAQAFDRETPSSISSVTPTWFDVLFIAWTIIGALVVLVALYMTDESKFHARHLGDSLNLEWIGLSMMLTCITVNTVAVFFFYDRPPTSGGSWFQIAFGVWGCIRLRDIRRAVRQLNK